MGRVLLLAKPRADVSGGAVVEALSNSALGDMAEGGGLASNPLRDALPT
jgi:hypothetical protein